MAAHDTIAQTGSARLSLTPARAAGWSGLAMLVAIIVNGPLSALRGLPDYWSAGAAADLGTYLADPSRLRLAVLFFFLSTLIFVFGIPFVSGLRSRYAPTARPTCSPRCWRSVLGCSSPAVS